LSSRTGTGEGDRGASQKADDLRLVGAKFRGQFRRQPGGWMNGQPVSFAGFKSEAKVVHAF
jgi:hypothetical protein